MCQLPATPDDRRVQLRAPVLKRIECFFEHGGTADTRIRHVAMYGAFHLGFPI